MKAPSCSVRSALALVVGLVGLSGCTRQTSQAPPVTKVVVTNVSPPPAAAASLQTNGPVTPRAAPVAAAPTATVAPQRIPLPPTVAEVVELAQSRVGDAVLLEYLKKSTSAFELTADQIIYLKDIGISEQVLAALVQRSQEAGAATVVQPPSVAEAAPAPQPASAPVPSAAAAQPAAPIYAEGTAAAPAAPAAPPAAETVYAQPVTQVTQNYFYSALSPYGAWVEVPSYGWCWQPTAVVVDPYWRPYCHGGRWLYTDCGWYWQSTYSWGWAPFHYGTWYRSPACGWVWVPGYTWSPAWVTWRYTDAHCGWAPLPPGCGWGAGVGLTYYGSGVSVGFSFGLGWDCYSFVSYRAFCDPHPHRHCLPHRELATVYNNSTVINNYIHGDNNTIVNNGIAPSRISAVTRSEVRKLPLRDVTDEPDAPRRADRLERDGRELAVYRPQPTRTGLAQPTPTSRQAPDGRKPTAPERTASPSNLAGGLAPSGVPLSSGRTRTENAPPARTATPASPAPTSPGVGSQPARSSRSEGGAVPAIAGTARSNASETPVPTSPRGGTAPARAPRPELSSTPSTAAPPRTSAPVGGSRSRPEVAPVRAPTPAAPVGQATPGDSSPSRSGSEPARTVSPSQPSRVERIPASRTSSRAPAVPSESSRPSGAAAPSTPSYAIPNRSGQAPAAPVNAPPAATPPPASRFTVESRTPIRTEAPRSEPRKLESAAPNSMPAPKFSPGGQSVYGSGSAPVSVPSASRSPTPSAPAYQAPRAPAPATRSAATPTPTYNTPPRPVTGTPSAPAYRTPSPPPASAPAPSAPRSSSSSNSSGGGGRSRSVQE
jgi:hypothetical protein